VTHAVNPSGLHVRALEVGDYDAWLPIWLDYNRFYGRFDSTALADDITMMAWSRFFDSNEPVHALVAESNGALLGLVHYLFHRSTTRLEPVCYLQDLFVTESARGSGVGRALIEGVYEQAKHAGSTRVYWQTHQTNVDAMKLYNKVAGNTGFVVYAKPL
jgi:GNAT superfamily N-acetyltransferase